MVAAALAGLVFCVTFAATSSPAFAEAFRFGSQGEGAGQLIQPRGVAVAQEGGDVYLVDQGNARIERWSAGGAFISAWGWGVANGSPAFQVCEAVCGPGLVVGGGGGQFAEQASGIAVDNSLGLSHGDVYAVDRANARVEQFAADGSFLAVFGGEVNETKDNTPGTTEAEKNVCTALSGDTCKAGVPGHGHGAFEGLGRNAIAVDSAGTLYVGDLERVQKLSAAGAFEGEVTLPPGTAVETLAVDSSKDLYVSMSNAEVNGAHKFGACAGVCVGKEIGTPRDAGQGFDVQLSVGPSDELFLYDTETRHIFEYTPGGEETLSLSEEFEDGGEGIAFGPGADALYVLRRSFVQVRPVPPAGPVVAEGSETTAELQPTSASVSASVNPEGPEATSYHFEYGTTTAYGTSTEEQPLSGEPFEDHTVSAPLTGLQSRTTYHFRVVVTNGSQTTFGPDATFTTLPPVGIESESVSQVTATSARLATTLNPHGVATEYRFEYGITTAYGTPVPVPDGEAGASTSDAIFSALVEGLAPETTYHYRVVARNALGTVEGPDRTFSTQAVAAPGIVDGRAWELVSPANKHGSALESITAEGGVIQAAEDGSRLAYIANGPVDSEPPGSRSVADTQLLAHRTGPGVWSTQDITTPHEQVTGLSIGSLSEYELFSPDVSAGLVEPFGTTALSPQTTERTPYRREADGRFTPLVYPGNVPEGTKFGGEEPNPGKGLFVGGVPFKGASADLSHVVVSSPSALVEGLAGEGHESLFEWSAGELSLASILPDGIPAAEEGMSAVLGRENEQVRNAVSANGDRIVFTAGGHLYVRDMMIRETVQVDTLAPGAKGGGGGGPVFQLATADGSKLFFTATARLTKDATAGNTAADLYVCDVAVVAGKLSCQLTDLTVALHPGEPADVQGAVIGADETGRYVYFLANGALAPSAAQGTCTGANPPAQPPGALCNLYVADTLSSTVALVAVVSGLDSQDWAIESAGVNLGYLSARVSGNGEWFAFMSSRPLTGFDNTDARSGESDQEVFLYRRSTGSLACMSCAPSGARPVGVFDDEHPPGPLVDRPRVWHGQTLAGSIPGWTRASGGRAFYQSRYLTDAGRLLFNSPVGLVSGDANGRMDVYEFEPNGVGGCARTSGCVGLISSGGSGEESAFVDASANGDDVFFLTAAELASEDTDGTFDFYDAHVCSAAQPCPSGTVSVAPACSTADSCRAAPALQPSVFGAPASATFSGPGNLTPAAAKPVVRPLTRAQRLARALKACARKPRRKRPACTAQARRRYGSAKGARHHITREQGRGK